jgi:hypothetical protein
MAVKTFTTGEVLTAADTNTYLANSGLVFVKQVTVGSAVSSVDVTSCFSSTYTNYRVLLNNIGGLTGGMNMGVRLLSGATATTTAYYGVLMYASVTVSGAYASATDNNGSSFSFVASVGLGSVCQSAFDIGSPYETKQTNIGPSNFVATVGKTDIGYYVGGLYNTTSYDGFRVLPNIGTMTGGTITVYGYRLG